MPGHKGKSLESLIAMIKETGFKIDVTELPGLDNLQDPRGPIMKAEEQAARTMGAEKTFFLVNGATTGIIAGIMATTKPSAQVLLPRNCHRSFWSALVLGDLTPVFVVPKYYAPLSISIPADDNAYKRAYEKAHDKNKISLAAVINPSYEGFVSKIEKIIAWAREKNMSTLVDEAHGSLFPLHNELPTSALQLQADIVVHGAHKTLGSLTQTALLHLGNKSMKHEPVRQAIQNVQTTSPSYLLMASLDEAIKNCHRESVIDNLLEINISTRKKISQIKGFQLIDEEILAQQPEYSADITKLVISPLKLGLTGFQLASILREQYGIQVEMAQWGYVVFLTGIGSTPADFHNLTEALRHMSQQWFTDGSKPQKTAAQVYQEEFWLDLLDKENMPPLLLSPRQSFYADTIEVAIDEAVGEAAGEFICPYPPGIPLLYPGEALQPQMVKFLQASNYKKIKIIN